MRPSFPIHGPRKRTRRAAPNRGRGAREAEAFLVLRAHAVDSQDAEVSRFITDLNLKSTQLLITVIVFYLSLLTLTYHPLPDIA